MGGNNSRNFFVTMTGSGGLAYRDADWFRKTSLLRYLEAGVRDGHKPDKNDVARVLRHALRDCVGDDLPLDRELIFYLAGVLDGSIKPREAGRPRVDDLNAQVDQALELVLEVEEKEQQLRLSGGKRVRGRAIAEVAKVHQPFRSPNSIKTLINRGPPKYEKELWKHLKSAVIEGCRLEADLWPELSTNGGKKRRAG